MSQVIRIPGVLDDGSAYGPLVSSNTSTTIQFPKNRDVLIEVAVTNPAGAVVDLTQDTGPPTNLAQLNVVWDLGRRRSSPGWQSCGWSGDTDDCLNVTGVVAAPLRKNVLQFVITPTLTSCMRPRRYYFDVSMLYLSKMYQFVRVGTLHLEPVTC